MKVKWTPEAIETYEQIIEYILINWTKKEVSQFIEQTEQTIKLIKKNPFMFIASTKNKQVRKGFVNRLISMFYQVNLKDKEIKILSFWNNRQNPNKAKFL